MEKYGTARQATCDGITRRMRFACWITKATDTYTEYVILVAFRREQWLRERISLRLYGILPVFLYFKARHTFVCPVRFQPCQAQLMLN